MVPNQSGVCALAWVTIARLIILFTTSILSCGVIPQYLHMSPIFPLHIGGKFCDYWFSATRDFYCGMQLCKYRPSRLHAGGHSDSPYPPCHVLAFVVGFSITNCSLDQSIYFGLTFKCFNLVSSTFCLGRIKRPAVHAYQKALPIRCPHIDPFRSKPSNQCYCLLSLLSMVLGKHPLQMTVQIGQIIGQVNNLEKVQASLLLWYPIIANEITSQDWWAMPQTPAPKGTGHI